MQDPRMRTLPEAEFDIKAHMKEGDLHIVIDPNRYQGKVYDHLGGLQGVRYDGKALDSFPAHCEGVNGPGYTHQGGDTVPGPYKVGIIYPSLPSDPPTVWNAFGRYAIQLIELANQENNLGRAGIMMHGGGSGSPNPLAPRQGWYRTEGCVRLENILLETWLVPLIKKVQNMGFTVYVTISPWNYG